MPAYGWSALQEPKLAGPGNRLAAGGNPQLLVDRVRLRPDGVAGQDEFPGDLRKRQVGGEQRQQAQLGTGQCLTSRTYRRGLPGLDAAPGITGMTSMVGSGNRLAAGGDPQLLVDRDRLRPDGVAGQEKFRGVLRKRPVGG